ncbi:MAG: redoxin domain-containing protein, partial [Clostridiales bacterium]|nr:redoxin domain-containing protein [Clostridiales bacterium]
MATVYDYKVKDAKFNEVSLEEYRGKVLLIVNTATNCGFTPQYEGLQKLYETYRDQGFEILDFPCNQFANQAPGNEDEIVQFCQTKYHTTFRTFAKIHVNGKQTEP